jgi:adenylate cyclase
MPLNAPKSPIHGEVLRARHLYTFPTAKIAAPGPTMELAFNPVSISTRRKLISILLSVTIFAFLAGLTTLAIGRPVIFGIIHAIFVGSGVGFFEQFYVQSPRGRWLRSMHPVRSILLYSVVVVTLYIISFHLSHVILWRFEDLPMAYRKLPIAIPLVLIFSVIGIVVMRAVHFIGIETLFHLMLGTYHRPVIQEKVLLFLDINNSTDLAERLGPVRTQSLLGKFLFDVSRPITDSGGDIYLYKGDGLIALWAWGEAIRADKILNAVDAIFVAVKDEQANYRQQFGVVPDFRVGVHGGDVVVSEQGDIKRAIGIYGSTINISARMEEAAKAHGVACVISGDVAKALSRRNDGLLPIGYEKIRGISEEIPIFEYRVAGIAAPVPTEDGLVSDVPRSIWRRAVG